MSLYPGPMRTGVHNVIQELLLRFAFAMQDVGDWLRDNGHRFEDWVAPSGRRAVPQIEEFWEMP